jgi:ABC-type transport system substrate-binding protein
MSLDRATIAAAYYRGTIDGTPCGLVSPVQTGWCLPYDEWPAELQQIYSYNPEKAEELLAEAGYPRGFATGITASQTSDLQLLYIINSYFHNINVEM